MAKAPQQPSDINPDAKYRVTLKRSVVLSPGVVARPRDELVLKGKAVTKHAAAIASYVKIAE